MSKRKTSVIVSIFIAIVQMFFLLLPTTYTVNDGRYEGEARYYSSIQMISTFAETRNDPDLNADDPKAASLISSCNINEFITFIFSMLLLVSTVLVSIDREEKYRVAEIMQYIFAVAIAGLPLCHCIFLNNLYQGVSTMTVGITTYGFLQMMVATAGMFAIIILEFSHAEKVEAEVAKKLSNDSLRIKCPSCQTVQMKNRETCYKCGKTLYKAEKAE